MPSLSLQNLSLDRCQTFSGNKDFGLNQFVLCRYLPRLRKRLLLSGLTCGISYKDSTIVNYNSRVVLELNIPHISTLDP